MSRSGEGEGPAASSRAGRPRDGWRGTAGTRRDWVRSQRQARAQRPAPGDPGRLPVLFEDNHLLVIVKPVGLLSQGDRTGDPSVLDLLREHLQRAHPREGNIYLGLVHRLDRPVSGVMVVAKTSKAARRLTEQLRARTVQKTYRAVVAGRPAPAAGVLHDHLLKQGPGRRALLLPLPTAESREAELSYQVLATEQGCSLIEVRLVTGRSHQIRAQLAGLGHPLLGDLRYGSGVATDAATPVALYAWRLTFRHPVGGEELSFEAPPPPGWPWPPPPGWQPREVAPEAEPGRPARAPARCGPVGPSDGGLPRVPPSRSPSPSPAPAPAATPVAGPDLPVLYCDGHLLVVAKPAGLPVQPTLDRRRANLLDLTSSQLSRREGPGRPLVLMTRLPVGASGAVLLARTRSGARSLDAQLKAGTLRRLFVLLVRPGPAAPPWVLAGWRGPDAGCRWAVVGRGPAGSLLLLVEPVAATARAVEELLVAQGWELASLAGEPRPEARHLLRLRFCSPGAGEEVEVEAPPPPELLSLLPPDQPRRFP